MHVDTASVTLNCNSNGLSVGLMHAIKQYHAPVNPVDSGLPNVGFPDTWMSM